MSDESREDVGFSSWQSLMSGSIAMRTRIDESANEGTIDSSRSASYGDIVVYSYRCYQLRWNGGISQEDKDRLLTTDPSNVTLEFLESVSNERCQIGENDVVPGLELPLRYSKANVPMEIRVASNFAYGVTGRPKSANSKRNADDSSPEASSSSPSSSAEIPPNADLEFHVDVHKVFSLDDLDNADVNNNNNISTVPQSVLYRSQMRKEIGNRWFYFRDYKKAILNYSRVVDLCDAIVASSGHSAPVYDVYMLCLNNLAACWLMSKDYIKAQEVCTKLLSIDSKHVKGLIKAARATLAIADFETCKACLDRATEVLNEQDAATNMSDSNTSINRVENSGILSINASDSNKTKNQLREEIRDVNERLKAAIDKYLDSQRKMAKKISAKLFSNTGEEVSNKKAQTEDELLDSTDTGNGVDKINASTEREPNNNLDVRSDKNNSISNENSDSVNDSSANTSQSVNEGAESASASDANKNKMEENNKRLSSKNMFLLFASSLVVVVISALIAYIVQNNQPQ